MLFLSYRKLRLLYDKSQRQDAQLAEKKVAERHRARAKNAYGNEENGHYACMNGLLSTAIRAIGHGKENFGERKEKQMERREKGKGNTWRKGRITQRILSLILSVCMAVILLPVTAKAEDAVETPIFSVKDGSTFEGTQEITISCATEGANIYYTLDGSTPSSTAGKVYESPITISVTSKVQAIAVKDGIASEVASATCTRIDVQASGYCGAEGDNLWWVFDSNTSGNMTISGAGAMKNWTNSNDYWTSRSGGKITNNGNIKNVVISNSVTSIGDRAFWDCRSLESVTIPDSVTTIGNFAFQKCRDKLTSINISANVTSIGIGAFSWCKMLETITVDSGNTVYKSEGNCIIEKNTNKLIAGCKESVIPETVTSIEAYAFYIC